MVVWLLNGQYFLYSMIQLCVIEQIFAVFFVKNPHANMSKWIVGLFPYRDVGDSHHSDINQVGNYLIRSSFLVNLLSGCEILLDFIGIDCDQLVSF